MRRTITNRRLAITFLCIALLPYSHTWCQDNEARGWNTYLSTKSLEIGLPAWTNDEVKKVYRIWTTYQVVELVCLNHTSFEGSIVNFVSKNNRKGVSKKTISENVSIRPELVNGLMRILHKANIETIVDSKQIPNYPKGFDGTTFIFEILIDGRPRTYSYWEPLNNDLTMPNNPDVNNVRNILETLNKELHLWKSFTKFTDSLPPGNYGYGGVNMIKVKEIF